MSQYEDDLKKKIMDIFGVTEEQVEEFEKTTGFRAAREAADKQKNMFIERINILRAHVEQGLVQFSESLAEEVRSGTKQSEDASGGVAIMKCRRCGDQISSRDVKTIIAWDKDHKSNCINPDGPLLPEEKQDDEPMVKVPKRVVESILDKEECSFNHKGDCEAHGFFDLEEDGEMCPQAELKEIIG